MRIPPAGLFLLAAGAQRLLGGRVSTPRLLLAVPLAGASGLLGLTAVGGFLRAGTTVDPVRVNRASTLVTDGALGWTRNPMYLALAGLLTAQAVARGSGAALLPVAGFLWAVDRGQVAAEEASLRGRFGPEYEDYARRVPRWLGWRHADDSDPRRHHAGGG